MSTIFYVGAMPTVEVAGIVFKRLKKVIVSDERISRKRHLFTDDFRVHSTIVTDVIPATQYQNKEAPLDITAIIPQFKTPDLITESVGTFKRFYPTIPLIVVDDGSGDASTDMILQLAQEYPYTQALVLEKNSGHGAALHAGIQQVRTARFFTMDSDCVVERGGFLELMENRMIDQGLYGIGVIFLFDWAHQEHYLHAVSALYDTQMYRRLPPFKHGPSPMMENTRKAQELGWRVECFPMFDYVWHKDGQTRKRFGVEWDCTNIKIDRYAVNIEKVITATRAVVTEPEESYSPRSPITAFEQEVKHSIEKQKSDGATAIKATPITSTSGSKKAQTPRKIMIENDLRIQHPDWVIVS